MSSAIRSVSMLFMSLFILFLIPGCVPYHKIIKSEFPQGTFFSTPQSIVAHTLRSLAFYEQFRTQARFDALWLSDRLRLEYVRHYAARRGLSEEKSDALLRQQLRENDRMITFYLFADIRDTEQSQLVEQNAFWTFYLATERGLKIKPTSVVLVDELEPEIAYFLGKRFSKNKQIYRLSFHGLDQENNRLDCVSKRLMLYCCSCEKFDFMEWSPKELNAHTEGVVENELPLDPLLC